MAFLGYGEPYSESSRSDLSHQSPIQVIDNPIIDAPPNALQQPQQETAGGTFEIPHNGPPGTELDTHASKPVVFLSLSTHGNASLPVYYTIKSWNVVFFAGNDAPKSAPVHDDIHGTEGGRVLVPKSSISNSYPQIPIEHHHDLSPPLGMFSTSTNRPCCPITRS